jgi:hypothetical protein
MYTILRRAVLATGLTAVMTTGLGAALAAPVAASQVRPMLSCEHQVLRTIGVGVVQFSVRCSGNSSSAYWAAGDCARAGHQRGPTEFPPFFWPGPGPWSSIGCPSGDYLVNYGEVHG